MNPSLSFYIIICWILECFFKVWNPRFRKLKYTFYKLKSIEIISFQLTSNNRKIVISKSFSSEICFWNFSKILNMIGSCICFEHSAINILNILVLSSFHCFIVGGSSQWISSYLIFPMKLVDKFMKKHSWLSNFPIHKVIITVNLDMTSFFCYVSILSKPVCWVMSVTSMLLYSVVVIYMIYIYFHSTQLIKNWLRKNSIDFIDISFDLGPEFWVSWYRGSIFDCETSIYGICKTEIVGLLKIWVKFYKFLRRNL